MAATNAKAAAKKTAKTAPAASTPAKSEPKRSLSDEEVLHLFDEAFAGGEGARGCLVELALEYMAADLEAFEWVIRRTDMPRDEIGKCVGNLALRSRALSKLGSLLRMRKMV